MEQKEEKKKIIVYENESHVGLGAGVCSMCRDDAVSVEFSLLTKLLAGNSEALHPVRLQDVVHEDAKCKVKAEASRR